MKKILFISFCTLIFIFNCEKSKDTITGTQDSGDKIQVLEIKRDMEVTCVNDSCVDLHIDFGIYRFDKNLNVVEIYSSTDSNVIKGEFGKILLLQELTLKNDWDGNTGLVNSIHKIPNIINIVKFDQFNYQEIQISKVMNNGTLYIKNQNNNYQIDAENEIVIDFVKNYRFMHSNNLIHDKIRIINHGFIDKKNVIVK